MTRDQVQQFLRAVLASDGPLREGWDPADAAALRRVISLLGEITVIA